MEGRYSRGRGSSSLFLRLLQGNCFVWWQSNGRGGGGDTSLDPLPLFLENCTLLRQEQQTSVEVPVLKMQIHKPHWAIVGGGKQRRTEKGKSYLELLEAEGVAAGEGRAHLSVAAAGGE